ncbi:MAG: hypothetical protein ACOC6H_02835 [Thermoproteota archaeon]
MEKVIATGDSIDCTLRIHSTKTAYLLPLTYSVDALHQAMKGMINSPMFLIDLAIRILYTMLFLIFTVQLLKRKIE